MAIALYKISEDITETNPKTPMGYLHFNTVEGWVVECQDRHGNYLQNRKSFKNDYDKAHVAFDAMNKRLKLTTVTVQSEPKTYPVV